LAKQKGRWIAVPTSSGSQDKPPCARISWFNKHGLDVQAMYPVRPEPFQDSWTWDALLKYAEPAAKDGMTLGCGMDSNLNTDGIDTHGALFKAFGAELMDPEGIIKVRSDEVRQVLEYTQKLVMFYPKDAVAYDDASNNRALISGKSALIFNPPSAWAVAVRDNRPVGRIAEPSRRLRGRRDALCQARSSSGASGRSARTSQQPRNCCIT
jgi:ABC-type glycerol-3-phosphate transport system substrate-binding protein